MSKFRREEVKEKRENHYIDKDEFYNEIVEYFDVLKDDPDAQIPNNIALKIKLLCENIGYSRNFCNYSFRDDMVLDAIENCIKYLKSFNLEKSKNPFAYFTTAAYYTFIRTLKKEQKYREYKDSLIDTVGFDEYTLNPYNIGDNFETAHVGDDEIFNWSDKE